MAIPTREAYGRTLAKLVEENKDIVVLDADLSGSTKTALAKKVAPERHFNMGIAEANMLGVAAGLAASGKTVFASSFVIFATGRAWEQMRNSVCYPELNVKLCGSHGGLSVGEDGASHQSLEDVAIMRAIPRIRVYQPCDAKETEAVIRHVAEIKGPCYVRLGRANVDDVYEGEVPDVTKVHVLRQGEKVALLATGYEVQQVLKAADILKEQGINATVVDIACIKPIDEEGVIDILKNHEHVFTVEEHSIVGGFGSAVCEVACNRYPHIIHRIGVNDIFGESGPAMAVITKYGLDGESIAKKVLETVK